MICGLMTYGPENENIGDELQSLAISKLMPSVDAYICREALTQKPEGDDQIRMTITGFFNTDFQSFVCHPQIEPLFIAFHSYKSIFTEAEVQYLLSVAPIGCRDLHTLRLCRRYDIPCYWSGCSTLTLNVEVTPNDMDIVYDGHYPWEQYLPACPGTKFNNYIDGSLPVARKLSLCEERLQLLASCRSVISSKIHGAWPRIANGAPTLVVDASQSDFRTRYEDLTPFVDRLPKYDAHKCEDFVRSPTPVRHMDFVRKHAEEFRSIVRKFFAEGVRHQGTMESVKSDAEMLKIFG